MLAALAPSSCNREVWQVFTPACSDRAVQEAAAFFSQAVGENRAVVLDRGNPIF
jgi:hypothetical protein